MAQTRSMASRQENVVENVAEEKGDEGGTGSEIQRRVAATEAGITEILRRMDVMAATQNQRQDGRLGRRSRRHRAVAEEDETDESGAEQRRKPRIRRDGQRKLEIPIFLGTEAHAWLSKVERYFRVNEIEEEEKVEAVMVFMEGSALTWFQWWEMRNPEPTWSQFRRELLNRFQPEMMDNPFGPLYSLRQTGTVAEFQADFERVVSMMRYEDEEVLKGAWLNGLRPSIREELLLYPLYRLADMIKFALKLERRNTAWAEDGLVKIGPKQWDGSNKGPKQWSAGGNKNWALNQSGPSQQRTNSGEGNISHTSTNASVNRGVPYSTKWGEKQIEGSGSKYQKLSAEEVRDRRDKGLCFSCNGKWSSKHQCPSKMMYMLIVEEDEVEPETLDEAEPVETAPIDDSAFHLSMQSLMGLSSTRTMKLWGEVGETRVIVLIDSGASNNFIKSELVKQLGLVIEATPVYKVEVGDGHQVECQGICRGLSLIVQNHPIKQDFHLFELGGVDMVLGLDWLTGLGEIKANFSDMTLRFGKEGRGDFVQGGAYFVQICRILQN